MAIYEIEIPEVIEKALEKVALKDGKTVQEVFEWQLMYYVGCALYTYLNPTHPVNTPNLSPDDRAEVMAVAIESGEDTARLLVNEKLIQ